MSLQLAERLDTTFVAEEESWRAVLDRDANRDGEFVYAVRSTGIYCRPSCPSRRPNRDQVQFFALPEAAEQAGFRSCLRCLPKGAAVRDPQAELVQRACRYIEEYAGEPLTLAGLADYVGLSPHHLQRTFKRIMGISPRQYAEARRLERFKSELKGEGTVTAALYEAGYNSSSRLYENAPAHLGMTPTAYRKGGEGMSIGYTIVDSPLGRLLVAATERGVCSVLLGDSDEGLRSMLAGEYPAAEVHPDYEGLGRWVSAILRYLDGEQPHLDLPLDVQATAFQWRVWQELRNIPYGSTRSYGDIARAIGQPSATRAVARACATNKAALVIPCHRVVREGGDLGGYRWGIERKRVLLDRERVTGK